DEVAGAVDDAEQRIDAVGDEPALEDVDDRNPAAGGGFERDAGVLLPRELEELRPLRGEERFVGGDDGFSQLERALDEGERDARPADQLDDDLARGVV